MSNALRTALLALAAVFLVVAAWFGYRHFVTPRPDSAGVLHLAGGYEETPVGNGHVLHIPLKALPEWGPLSLTLACSTQPSPDGRSFDMKVNFRPQARVDVLQQEMSFGPGKKPVETYRKVLSKDQLVDMRFQDGMHDDAVLEDSNAQDSTLRIRRAAAGYLLQALQSSDNAELSVSDTSGHLHTLHIQPAAPFQVAYSQATADCKGPAALAEPAAHPASMPTAVGSQGPKAAIVIIRNPKLSGPKAP